jgi:hypothetical protein
MKIRFLLCLLSISIFSCSETVTNRPKKGDLLYFETDSIEKEKIDSTEEKVIDYEIKIEKVDSLITYKRPENYHKLRHQTLFKKYKPNNKFQTKLVPLDSGEMFIQSALIEHRRFSFPEHNNYRGYIIKKLTQNYRNVYTEGGGDIKTAIQIFPVDQNGKISKKPLYKFQAFGDAVEIYDREGYFLSTQFGCCMNTSTYELFDLKGNYKSSSNHSIKGISVNDKSFFIGILKNEIPDYPVIFIQDSDKNIQYISFSKVPLDNILGEHFYLKFKNEKSPRIKKYAESFTQHELNNLDDLEIWLPFNKKDTLKIPFKNNKAFGMKDAQLKISLLEK